MAVRTSAGAGVAVLALKAEVAGRRYDLRRRAHADLLAIETAKTTFGSLR